MKNTIRTVTVLLSLALVAAVSTACAGRQCSDWPGTCIIQ